MGTNKHKQEAAVLRLETRFETVAGMRTEYRLEFENGYWLEAMRGGERSRVFLGDVSDMAWKFLKLAAQGHVTPCTLEAVCADFIYLQEVGDK